MWMSGQKHAAVCAMQLRYCVPETSSMVTTDIYEDGRAHFGEAILRAARAIMHERKSSLTPFPFLLERIVSNQIRS